VLVLTRCNDEEVVLRDRETQQIIGTVKVVELRSSKVRLGFEFPPDVAIFRKEIDVPAPLQEAAA
jgi:carbon storage regulator CsrA